LSKFKQIRDLSIIAVTVVAVTTLAFAEDSNITNTTTTTSTVTSNNTNTNNNTNVNQTTSTNTNTNWNTNNTTINSTATNTNNNTNVSTSTSNVTSNITQTQNVTNTSDSTVNSTSNNTNVSTNSNTNVNTSTSSSTVNTQNVNTNNNNNVNSSQNVNTNTSTSTSSATQKVTQRIKTAPPSAVAPSIMSYSQDLCTTGASAAVQTQIFGISAGKSVVDENCERLKLSKGLYDMGMKVASVALLCQDARVFKAMVQAGTPCPYKGKIGAEAQKAWDENPEDRPDWDEVRKEMKNLEFRAYKKKDFCKKYPTQKVCTDS
jgi:DNA polymerase III alpha subunit (gram-positive type)